MLPRPTLTLVNEQKARIQGQWVVVAERFPTLGYEEYLRSWLIMNTRTFYHSTPETESYEWVERIGLLPVADLLNHAERGCKVLYTDTEYTITTDRVYNAGDEICNSYGEHTNDFLLGEYGFILLTNCWDEICVDDAILPQLSQVQKSNLEKENLTKGFKIGNDRAPCDRTRRAMQILCRKKGDNLKTNRKENNENYLEPEHSALLAAYLEGYMATIDKTMDGIEEMKNVERGQKELLLQRWRQIRTAVSEATDQLENTTSVQ
ncbi:hypothetical protein PFICI_15069 [Pestalotiopsis fici W106-1]|uniref:Uncharacterized protein n=1 Tax=Pestalotiopsis fici (strain W106-1 / CGMCC3.15140) TaxID=1229662 RepID=W3WH50_PESFW|nr:uncharacterized protein PFICI_15069 [Pestalotiopsis fici W106-1]ETS73124.1 hypothetical protein PFICI_15069 [Pestalotiopsis fici W106-1]